MLSISRFSSVKCHHARTRYIPDGTRVYKAFSKTDLCNDPWVIINRNRLLALRLFTTRVKRDKRLSLILIYAPGKLEAILNPFDPNASTSL